MLIRKKHIKYSFFLFEHHVGGQNVSLLYILSTDNFTHFFRHSEPVLLAWLLKTVFLSQTAASETTAAGLPQKPSVFS